MRHRPGMKDEYKHVFVLCMVGSYTFSVAVPAFHRNHPHEAAFPISNRISSADVLCTVYSETNSVSTSLFGEIRNFSVSKEEMAPGIHPRIVFSAKEWDNLARRYAEKRNTPSSWANHVLHFTQGKGPGNPVLKYWAEVDTSEYTGESDMNRTALKSLAMHALNMTEHHEGGLFMYALHTAVHEKLVAKGGAGYLPTEQNTTAVIQSLVNFAKILLAHYATYGCTSCPYVKGIRYSDLWQQSRLWGISNDWYTGGLGMALSYDVLHVKMTATQRRFVRSAIAIAVKGRQHWGITDTSDRISPNVLLQPHRIFSNWAAYHANLYLTNLAIEGETDFDAVTTAAGVGFNQDIDVKTVALIDAFMKHSIYPDGSNFEDGYNYNLAFREGSLQFVALARRGHNHLDTNRFRNFIYNAAQMYEPYRCGNFIGHSSGGGLLYPAFPALFRYAYPSGELPNMLWRQRMGVNFKNNNPCRVDWHQIMMQTAILGGEHGTTAESPSGMSKEASKYFALSVYQPRRGLLIARSDLSGEALYIHFDARPDAFFLGHDNADRGVFTLTALRRTWFDELQWNLHSSSHDHSLMHIDGQAQALKAPSVRMLKVRDEDEIVIAAADLTYAYNVQWARAWPTERQPSHFEILYKDGVRSTQLVQFAEKETGHPLDFGWPTDDDGADIGFRANTSLWGEPGIGFNGLYTWKRSYREVPLLYGVRTVVLVRSFHQVSYMMIGDNFKMSGTGKHNFESHLILAAGVQVMSESVCSESFCKISLSGGDDRVLDVHVVTRGKQLNYRVDPLGKSNFRLVITSRGLTAEQFCMALHPHMKEDTSFFLERKFSICNVHVGDRVQQFEFNAEDHTLELYKKPVPSPSELSISSPTLSPSEAVSTSPSPTSSIPTVPSLSPTSSASLSVSPLISSTPRASMTVSPSASTSPSASQFASPSISTSSSVSMSASSRSSTTPSATPSATPSISEFSPSISPTSSTSDTQQERPEPTPKSSPSPTLTPRPMRPLPLRYARTRKVRKKEMSKDFSSFYDPSSGGYQVVFRYFTQKPKRRYVSTCSRFTTCKTRITIYDCGISSKSPRNYYWRKCKLVADDTDARKCFKYASWVTFRNWTPRLYFIVISCDKVPKKPLKFAIKAK